MKLHKIKENMTDYINMGMRIYTMNIYNVCLQQYYYLLEINIRPTVYYMILYSILIHFNIFFSCVR